MAKRSTIVKNEQRRRTVERWAPRRAGLRARTRDTSATPEERLEAQRALSRLPRDASPTRVRNRDAVDGRPRGHLRKVGLSRIRFRELAHAGHLPGITRSSW
ncbi:30S ribosomal protein S14 [Auraticoccus monumenti]|uniref:Small ribosomal subunit protein uS14 n=1 Tax=Auraticoccus monumenti TaxID=675864 RepID=A0A1G6ZMJ3_9ACTN|nr:30S ribosomal protein S14 [Auraticoccus monumenti]SDE03653.1 SSU ribosomal protein S14P [Auraticoccus monumenti]